MKQKSFSRFLCIMVLLALFFGAALPAYAASPIAVNDGPYTTPEATALVVPDATGLLANDSDPDGNPLEVDNWSTPTCGGLFVPCGTISAVNTATGAFTYTPPAGFAGTVTFTYTVTDNTVDPPDSAMVTIIVQATGTNDAPTIAAPASVSTAPSTAFIFTTISANDIDAGNDPLNVTISVPASSGSFLLDTGCATGSDTDGSDGTLNLNGDLVCINDVLNGLSFTPDGTLVPGNSVTMTIMVDDLGNNGTPATPQTDTAMVTIFIAGIVVDELGGVLVEEGNPATDTYQINLQTAPASDVIINISPDANCLINDPLTTADDFLTFNNANGTNPLTVTVSSFQDSAVEGDHDCLITHSVDPTSDPGYIGMTIADVLATVLDDDTPDLIVTAGGISLDESNSTPSTYTVRLGSNPGAGAGTVSVTLAVQSNPDLECTIMSTNPVTFTTADWFTDKNVDVVVIDDGQVEGNHTCHILHTVTVATPPSPYQGITEDLFVPVTDNDNVSIVLAHVGGGNTTIGEEPPGGFTDNYTVRLGSLPLGDVSVAITPDSECTVSTPTVNFTTVTWNTPVTITVTSTPDTDVEGNHTCVISHDATSVADAAYNDMPPVNFNVNVVDDDGGANDPPVAVDDTFSTAQDTPLNIAAPGILANDTDADLDTLTAVNPSSIIPGGAGTLTVNTNGSFDYTPTTGFTGTASFTYQAFDGTVNSNTATVTITVTPAGANVPPVANNDAYNANELVPLVVAAPGVLTNDTDANSDPLQAQLVAGPTNGTLTLNADGSFTYTSNAGATTDSFTYNAFDGTVPSAVPATVTITITPNSPPVANNDAYNANEQVPLVVAAPGVLSNDTDPNGNPLQAQLVAGPTNGTLTLNADGSFTYTSNAGATTDSFTYNAFDGAATSAAPATVTITIAANNAPVAVADAYNATEQVLLTIAAPGVLGNDSDPDGNPIQAVLDATTTNGTLTLNADGSFTYTSNAGATTDSFTYHATDGAANSNVVTVTLTITTNTPPVANNDAYNATELMPLNIAAPGVLANDTDADGNPLQAQLVTNVTNGTLTLNADGSFTYTSNAGATSDSFTYNAFDGAATSAAPATVTITITPAGGNVPPVAVADAYNATELMPLNIAAPGVLANDTDADGNPLQAQLVTNVTNGTLTLNADGSFTYTSNAGATSDSFTYNAFDGVATSVAPATVTITITPTGANTAPVITSATPNLSGTLVVLDVIFTDNPGDTHTATIDWGDGSSSAGLVTGLTVQGSHDYGTNGSFTITINVIDQLGAIGTHSLILDVGTGEVRFPPPVALCMDQNFIADSMIRANVPDAIRHTVRCRPIVANGNYTNSPEEQAMSSANIGNLSVLQMGVQQAVDVFSPEGLVDLSGVTVCLRGSGTLLHLYGAPRTPHTVPTYPVAAFPGFTCGSIPQTGTLVLVNGSSTSGSGGGGSNPANTPVPPTPSDPGLRLNSFPECTAVAFGGVNVRSTPSERGALLGVLSPDTPMNLITRVGMWYVIDYQGQTGYVRMDLVAFSCSG